MYNEQIDSLLQTCSSVEDFTAYIPIKVCELLDSRIQSTILTNSHIIQDAMEDMVPVIETLKDLIPINPDENTETFRNRLYNMYKMEMIDLLPAGFSTPVANYPTDHCENEAGFNALSDLIERTRDILTFEEWLNL